jgi:hypothetical protein
VLPMIWTFPTCYLAPPLSLCASMIYPTAEIHKIDADEVQLFLIAVSSVHIGQLRRPCYLGYHHAVSDKNLAILDVLLSPKTITSTMRLALLNMICSATR